MIPRKMFIEVISVKKFTVVLIVFLLPLLILYYNYGENLDTSFIIDDLRGTQFKEISFLVNTANCKIPDLNPLNSDILPFFKKEKYEACSDKPLLSFIEKRNGVVTLKINRSAISMYSKLPISCCYSKILRKEADRTVAHSACEWFHNEITITYPYIRVSCKNIFGLVYRNVHAVFLPHNRTKVKPAYDRNKYKIFLIGIDSVSRLNLQRSMPKVYSYLENNFVGFQGYNKIEDNTFPNIMAILTGRSQQDLDPVCRRNESFDKCDFIWKAFKESGYFTAYGEDEPFLNTFNYLKPGFIEPPTDFYLRPYFLSAYLLPITFRSLMSVCTGMENTAERILNAAKDYIVTTKHDPSFALFWINSFSHDNVNLPTSMDDKFLEFLTDSETNDALQDSVVVVFSDHGFRFGDMRFTYSGWLEERLPFLYFKLPRRFKTTRPEFVNNLVYNARNSLTTPYDFYMTLQHLLKLSNDSYSIGKSLGCQTCQSLFRKIPQNRSCEDGCIPQHWCTCQGYTSMSRKSEKAVEVGQYLVNEINRLTKTFSEGFKCVNFALDSVQTIGRSTRYFANDNGGTETFLILIKTAPYAMFEATLKAGHNGYELLGDISRLNRYSAYTHCIHTDKLKKYCFCDVWWVKLLDSILSIN